MIRLSRQGQSISIAAPEVTNKHLLDELLRGELSKHIKHARVLCHIILNLQRCKACNTPRSTSFL